MLYRRYMPLASAVAVKARPVDAPTWLPDNPTDMIPTATAMGATRRTRRPFPPVRCMDPPLAQETGETGRVLEHDLALGDGVVELRHDLVVVPRLGHPLGVRPVGAEQHPVRTDEPDDVGQVVFPEG